MCHSTLIDWLIFEGEQLWLVRLKFNLTQLCNLMCLVKALLTASTIINYHIKWYVKCEMWNIWACSKHKSSRPEVFCKKGVVRNFTKFTAKHLYQSLFFNKVAGLRPVTLLKNRLWHRCFPEIFAKFLRAPFLTEQLLWLLLNRINKLHDQALGVIFHDYETSFLH